MPFHNQDSQQHPTTEYHSLIPRTPHSRSGHFQDAFDIPNSDSHGVPSESQTDPLLGNDSDEAKDHDDLNKRERRMTLVVISLTLAMLLLLLIRAIQSPDGVEQIYDSTTEQTGEDTTTEQMEIFTGLPPNYKVISYGSYTQFPLTPSQYRTECVKANLGHMAHSGYWADGQMDVPHPADKTEVVHGPPLCKSTITYMLGGEVGLLADLALMAQVAGLARERNRTFLIDDTYWNRGKWSDYFEDVRELQPGPEPGCKAPPPEELVACPRTARHWVVNSQTSWFHFGHAFFEAYEDPYSLGIARLKPIYNRSRGSFKELFRPKAELTRLIREARLEFATAIARSGISDYVSVHIRQGDRVGMSWKYHNSHLPVENYAKAAEATWTRLNLTNPSSNRPVFYFASDSPSALHEFLDHFSLDVRIYSLSRSKRTALRELASPEPYTQSKFNELADDDKIRLTRGMIVDFALLSGLWGENKTGFIPSATVCALSSNVCKTLALGFGWVRAFGDLGGDIDEARKRWVEIDNAGAITPEWEAFEVFS